MGTNYYLEPQKPCECCKRPYEGRHIGKSSAGWCFSLHVYPDDGIADLPDWWSLWTKEGAVIRDEYGVPLTANEMLAVVCARFGRRNKPDEPAGWYSSNHGQPGPWGLARHKIDHRHCIGHGTGTYDLLIGGEGSW